ncbi:hypothetical protein BDZ89DRAFT_670968 [Hymenopellis radicata]|nr:hypothetical protein BDZ89DRAFT_670968 [Hymenopellis radicata]
MQALHGSVHRWQSLTVGESVTSQWFSGMNFTNLTQLHISNFSSICDFPDVPNLRVLHYGMYEMPRSELGGCPWSRLTRLRAHSIDRRLLDTLPAMVELQRLELRVLYGRFPSPCPSIFLPSVTSLLLSDILPQDRDLEVFLDSLCMPALQELELVFGNYGFPDSDAEFELEDDEENYTVSFRSSMRLDGSTVLHITSQLAGYFRDSHVELLRVSCNVEKLTLRVRIVPRGVCLDRTMSPNLTALDIHNCGLGMNTDAPELWTMFGSQLDESFIRIPLMRQYIHKTVPLSYTSIRVY